MIENIQLLYHSSIRINKDIIIYIDPFKINKKYNDADMIFITHSHYDHYSLEDINKVKKDDTIFAAPKDVCEKLKSCGIKKEKIIEVIPNEKYRIDGIEVETIPAYNLNKEFHPKINNWVGYIIEINCIRYYISGDTDFIKENKKIKCDVCFVAVGGTYTMTAREAADLVNIIKPKIAIPTHYGCIVGNKKDGEQFIENLNSDIKGILLMK